MDCLSRTSEIREALLAELYTARRLADEIVSRLENRDLALALDVAAIRQAQGPEQAKGAPSPESGSPCPFEDLTKWDEEIGLVQARLQDARDVIARLKAEELQLTQELTWPVT